MKGVQRTEAKQTEREDMQTGQSGEQKRKVKGRREKGQASQSHSREKTRKGFEGMAT